MEEDTTGMSKAEQIIMRHAARDEALLEKYRAQDARRGPPSRDVLTERASKAVSKRFPKTALEAIRQGADVNAYVRYETRGFIKVNFPLVMAAAEQNMLDVLRELVKRGANRAAPGYHAVSAIFKKEETPFPFFRVAASEGQVATMKALLEGGTEGLQPQLEQALLAATGWHWPKADMVRVLLDHGATGFEQALRNVEDKYGTEEIQKMLRARAAEQGIALHRPGGRILAQQEKEISHLLDNTPELQRIELLRRLQEKYAADFEAAAKSREPQVPPAPTQKPKNALKKNALNM